MDTKQLAFFLLGVAIAAALTLIPAILAIRDLAEQLTL